MGWQTTMADAHPGLSLKPGTACEHLETRAVQLRDDQDYGRVIYTARQLAQKAGFSETEATLIATAASELATNIIRYARTGTLTIRLVRRPDNNWLGLELFASDQGPGIQDLDLAMRENYSSLQSSLGLGLPSVRRIMDEFQIETIPGQGTRVLTTKFRSLDRHQAFNP